MSDVREGNSVEYNSTYVPENLSNRGSIKKGAIQRCADVFNSPEVNDKNDIEGVKLAKSLMNTVNEAYLAHKAEEEHLVNSFDKTEYGENNLESYGKDLVGEIKSEISSSYREQTTWKPESIQDDREH